MTIITALSRARFIGPNVAVTSLHNHPVRPPPPIQTPPAIMAWFVISGLFYLVVGLFSVFGTRPRPMVPASYVPGFIFLCVGAGFGMSILDRYFPKLGAIACWGLVPVIFYMEAMGRNSALPLMLYAATFQLVRALLRVTLTFEE